MEPKDYTESLDQEGQATLHGTRIKLGRNKMIGRIKTISVYELLLISVVSNRMNGFNVSRRSPLFILEQTTKQMVKHTSELKDTAAQAVANMANGTGTSDLEYELINQSVSLLLKMMMLSLEQITHILHQLPESEDSIADLLEQSLNRAYLLKGFKVKPKTQHLPIEES